MDPDLSHLVGLPVVAIGADVVDIQRMRDLVARRPSFVDRVFTATEQAYSFRAADPAERLAARFAAKEAGLKVLGVGLGGADFVDFEVVRLETGAPTLLVTGRAAERAGDLGIGRWLLTLSHSQTTAYAVAAGLAVG